MGRHAIEEKLAMQLDNNQVLPESVVVYILVGIRKLLEIGNDSNTYPSLRFHCDWALHSKLDRKGALAVIKQFDDFEDAWAGDNTDLMAKAQAALSATVGADKFRTELAQFLKVHKLPTTLCDDDTRWVDFLRVYGAVIHDAPLEFNLTRIKHVSSVVVRRSDEPGDPDVPVKDFLFALEWEPMRFDKKPGMRYRVNFRKP